MVKYNYLSWQSYSWVTANSQSSTIIIYNLVVEYKTYKKRHIFSLSKTQLLQNEHSSLQNECISLSDYACMHVYEWVMSVLPVRLLVSWTASSPSLLMSFYAWGVSRWMQFIIIWILQCAELFLYVRGLCLINSSLLLSSSSHTLRLSLKVILCTSSSSDRKISITYRVRNLNWNGA